MLNNWWFWAPTLVQALLALGLCQVPLFNVLGYEFCCAMCLVAALTAPWIGLWARQSLKKPLAVICSLPGWALLHLLPGLLIICLNAWRVKNCNFSAGLGFFILLPGMTAIYVSMLAYWIGSVFVQARLGLRLAVIYGLFFSSLAISLHRLYSQPPIFAFNHVWGYFAGSLYDEAIALDMRLLMFRLGTLLRSLLLCGLALYWRQWMRVYARMLPWVVVTSLVLVMGYDAWIGSLFGYMQNRADIERQLPVVVKRGNLVLHLPTGLEQKQIQAIADDHAYRLHVLLDELQIHNSKTLHSYVYRDAAQKAELIGARYTMIAKPWNHEIHIHGTQTPHPLMPHELAHVVAANFGSSWLKISAHLELLPNMGIVEGFAQAVTPDFSDLSLHNWARASQLLGDSTPIEPLLSFAGFWSQPPKRAYVLTGSFIRFLISTYGVDKFKRAYPNGDFEGAYNQPLSELIAAWQTFLSTVKISEREKNIAADNLSQPSIFGRMCAHEIANLFEQAKDAEQTYKAYPQVAISLYRKICDHLEDAPQAKFELAQALYRANEHEVFLSLAAELLHSQTLTTMQRAKLLLLRCEVQAQNNQLDAARESSANVLAMHLDVSTERLAWIYHWALDLTPSVRQQVLQFLRGDMPAVPATLLLAQLSTLYTHDSTYAYLVARQLIQANAWAQAIDYLRTGPVHPFAPIEAERQRLLANCLWHIHRLDGAINTYSYYEKIAITSGQAAQAHDWLQRITWQRDTNESGTGQGLQH